MNNYFFSIIIPIYNSEKYLKECVDSILNQSFKSFEIILVDDGSTDNSSKICDTYKKLYEDKIKVIHKINEGQLASRIQGLKIASGDYIYYVDSDDTIEPNLLSDIYDVIKTNSLDVIIFKFCYTDENGNFKRDSKSILKQGFVNKEKLFDEIIKSYDLYSLCTKVFRRNLFDKIKFNKQYYFIKNGEDLFQSLPALFKAKSFYYLDHSYYNYRENSLSISRKYNIRRIKSLIYVFLRLYYYLVKLGFDSYLRKKSFFSFCFSILWNELFCYFNYYQNKKYNKDLKLLLNSTLKNKHWLRHINLSLFKKFGILLFITKQWHTLYIYYYLVYIFYTCGIKKLKEKFLKNFN